MKNANDLKYLIAFTAQTWYNTTVESGNVNYENKKQWNYSWTRHAIVWNEKWIKHHSEISETKLLKNLLSMNIAKQKVKNLNKTN